MTHTGSKQQKNKGIIEKATQFLKNHHRVGCYFFDHSLAFVRILFTEESYVCALHEQVAHLCGS